MKLGVLWIVESCQHGMRAKLQGMCLIYRIYDISYYDISYVGIMKLKRIVDTSKEVISYSTHCIELVKCGVKG